MADPLTNLQVARSLFAGVPAAVERAGDMRIRLAMDQRNRQRQLEDQAAAFDRQRALTTLTTDRYLQVEKERSERQEGRDEKMRQRQVEEAARRAYAAYTTLAADASETPKALAEFGKDAESQVAAIEQEMARIQGRQNDAAFDGLVASYNQQLRSLKAMTALSPEDLKDLDQQVLGRMLPEDTDEDDWPKVIAAFASGSSQKALAMMGPKDRAAFEGQRSGGVQALRSLRQKDPAYVAAVQRLSGLQNEVTRASFKNPKWAKALGRLGAEETGTNATSAGITELDFEKMAGTKPAAQSLPPPAAATNDDGGYGGALGVGSRALGYLDSAGIRPSTADERRRLLTNLLYVPGAVAQGVGGSRLVEESGLDQVDTLRSQLESARPALRRAGESTGPAIIRRLQGLPGDALDYLLRSIAGQPKVEPEPAQ